MPAIFSNNAVSILSTTLSAASPTLLLTLGEGDKFPNPGAGEYFTLTLEDRRTGELEITNCTARNGDQLTLNRGQEGTSALSWEIGSQASHRTTAASLNAFAANTDLSSLEARVAQIEASYQIKVGGLHFSDSGVNPGEVSQLGYGTWASFGAGRAIVGVGNNGESQWTNGLTRGAETHTLITDEVEAHSHGVAFTTGGHSVDHHHELSFDTGPGGLHSHTISGLGGTGGTENGDLAFNASGGSTQGQSTSVVGDHVHNVTGQTVGTSANHTHSWSGNSADTGGGLPHNNVQPSIAVYIWRRTA